MTKLTRACTYALEALAELAGHRDNRPVASHTLARARKIPERFLLKVLKPLADRGILNSCKGPNGGYRMARPADQITMLEVVESVDGPLTGRIQPMEGTVNELLGNKLQAIADAECAEQRRRLGKITLAELASGNPDRAAGKRTRATPRKASAGKGK